MDLIPFSSRRLQGEEDCEKAERVTLCNKLLVPETPSPVGPVCVREMDTCCDLSPTLSASSDWAGCGPQRDAGSSVPGSFPASYRELGVVPPQLFIGGQQKLCPGGLLSPALTSPSWSQEG